MLALDVVMVSDIRLGAIGSDLRSLTDVNETLFFIADDGASGWELWKSNGTNFGTVRVKDIMQGSQGSYPNDLTNIEGTLFFTARNGADDYELWKSDGTEAGTQRVKDIWPGSAYGSNPRNLTNVNGTLFFVARDVESNYELWTSDGTEAGTERVRDIRPGSGDGSYPRDLTNVSGTLFFTVNDGTSGRELWRSDGTEAGTVLVNDIRQNAGGSYPYNLTNVGGTLYFSANDGTSGRELWQSDGTEAGTALVKDISPGDGNSSEIQYLTDVNGTLFFTLVNHGGQLWKSDGTEAGTVQVKDIVPPGGYYAYSGPGALTNVDGTLYFQAEDLVNGSELWKSDGTEAGTLLVRDIAPGSRDVYFCDFEGEYSCYSGHTESFPHGSGPSGLTSFQGQIFFTANDRTHGDEIWVSDGTEAGTYMVADIRESMDVNPPQGLTVAGNTLYFTADDGIHGRELWKVVVEDEAIPGDTNGDGAVNIEDLNNVRNHFGATGEGVLGDTAPFDGVVDIQDLNAVRNNFGAAGGASTAGAGPSDRATTPSDGAQLRVEPSRANAYAVTSRSDARLLATQAADVLFGMFAHHASPTLAQKPLARRQLTR